MSNSNINWSDKSQSTPMVGQSSLPQSPLFPSQTSQGVAGQSTVSPSAMPSQPSLPSQPVTPIMPGQFQTGQPITGTFRQAPPPTTDINYIPGFLASNIGRSVRAEFIIGSSQYVDKAGILSAVGINYFVLQDPSSRTYTMCDLYSVRFVTFLST